MKDAWGVGLEAYKKSVAYTRKEVSVLVERVKALETEVEGLQERGIDYRGVFKTGTEYKRGDVCTHSGSLWIAHRQTDEAPPGNGWTLCVKQGGKK